MGLSASLHIVLHITDAISLRVSTHNVDFELLCLNCTAILLGEVRVFHNLAHGQLDRKLPYFRTAFVQELQIHNGEKFPHKAEKHLAVRQPLKQENMEHEVHLSQN